jgi:hypothetical protein
MRLVMTVAVVVPSRRQPQSFELRGGRKARAPVAADDVGVFFGDTAVCVGQIPPVYVRVGR